MRCSIFTICLPALKCSSQKKAAGKQGRLKGAAAADASRPRAGLRSPVQVPQWNLYVGALRTTSRHRVHCSPPPRPSAERLPSLKAWVPTPCLQGQPRPCHAPTSRVEVLSYFQGPPPPQVAQTNLGLCLLKDTGNRRRATNTKGEEDPEGGQSTHRLRPKASSRGPGRGQRGFRCIPNRNTFPACRDPGAPAPASAGGGSAQQTCFEKDMIHSPASVWALQLEQTLHCEHLQRTQTQPVMRARLGVGTHYHRRRAATVPIPRAKYSRHKWRSFSQDIKIISDKL